jgi:hypothetical protein
MVRVIALVAAVLMVIAFLSGCAGQSSYGIKTGGNGSVYDVQTVPFDGDYDVPTNIWIRVYWPSGTEPPPEFKFKLRDSDDVRVNTYRHDGDEPNEWYFEPVDFLDYDSRYKVEIISGEQKVTTYFFTTQIVTLSGTRAVPNVGPRKSGSEAEQTIKTR